MARLRPAQAVGEGGVKEGDAGDFIAKASTEV